MQTGSTSKITYDNTKTWVFKSQNGDLTAAYMPNLDIDENSIYAELSKIEFTRVHYISKYNKANRTPRLTWAYGVVNSNMPNPDFNPQNESDLTSKLRSIPNPNASLAKSPIMYRDLNFIPEIMPAWLENLSQYCRMVSIMNWGFDPEFNSVIIGRYDDGSDEIGFHTDASQVYQTHFLCANVTIGMARDFQFKTECSDGTKQTHEIKLDHKSVFFFIGVEHALPKRAGVKAGEIRYSISFRNMKNDIGIGNSYYYCRGLAGAVDDEAKKTYIETLGQLQLARK